MKLVIVGGYHDKKVICLNELVPIRLSEDIELSVRPLSPDIPVEMDTYNVHEYIPQSIKFGFGRNDLVVLVPNGQDVSETIGILVRSHGESL